MRQPRRKGGSVIKGEGGLVGVEPQASLESVDAGPVLEDFLLRVGETEAEGRRHH